MSIIVLSPHLSTDPDRKKFYKLDASNKYKYLKISRLFTRIKIINYFFTSIKVRFLCRREDDTFLFEDPRLGMVVRVLFKLTNGKNKKFVFWNFNILSNYTGLKLRFTKFALKGNCVIVVYSKHEATKYKELFDISDDQVYFKYFSGPYIEDQRYVDVLKQSIKNQYIVSPGFSGRNFHLLKKVAEKMPLQEFILLTYPSFVKGIDFSDNVKIIHGISELEYCRYIANAKICFLPIGNKNTANGQIAIVQSMSLQTLLITNETPGTRDYLRNEENCILIDENDVDSIVNKLENVNEITSSTIIKNAYSFAKRNYSLDQSLVLFKQILSK